MGRAPIRFVHTRSIDVTMTGVSIQYTIPLYDDRACISELQSATVKDGMLIVNYSATQEAKKFTRPPVVFERVEREITFD